MSESPVKFRVEALNMICTLGFIGESDGKYTLLFDETNLDDLPQYKELGEVPEVAHSHIDEYNGATI